MSETYRDENCLEHMIEACRSICRIANVPRVEYDKSEEKQLALERLFEIIGEAASKVSDAYQNAHPQISWRQTTAMRNFVIHDYAGVDLDVIWDSAQTDIPKLLLELEAILSAEAVSKHPFQLGRAALCRGCGRDRARPSRGFEITTAT